MNADQTKLYEETGVGPNLVFHNRPKKQMTGGRFDKKKHAMVDTESLDICEY